MRTIVTGAASGIGRATAARLAASGDASLLLVDRNEQGLAAVADEVRGSARVESLALDLTATTSGDAIVRHCIDRFGGIDAIVSNAGAIQVAPLEELSVEEFDYLFAVNTRPTWLLAKAAFPFLKASRGALVATGSIAAENAAPPLGAYSASKAALVMLVRQMALEWGPHGIRCNCVSPGPTLTPMVAEGYADLERRRQREQGIPLRKLGSAEDVAAAITFLIGPDAGNITGQNLTVDGGLGQALMALSGAVTGRPQKG